MDVPDPPSCKGMTGFGGAKRTFAKHRRLLSADSVEKVFLGEEQKF